MIEDKIQYFIVTTDDKQCESKIGSFWNVVIWTKRRNIITGEKVLHNMGLNKTLLDKIMVRQWRYFGQTQDMAPRQSCAEGKSGWEVCKRQATLHVVGQHQEVFINALRICRSGVL